MAEYDAMAKKILDHKNEINKVITDINQPLEIESINLSETFQVLAKPLEEITTNRNDHPKTVLSFEEKLKILDEIQTYPKWCKAPPPKKNILLNQTMFNATNFGSATSINSTQAFGRKNSKESPALFTVAHRTADWPELMKKFNEIQVKLSECKIPKLQTVTQRGGTQTDRQKLIKKLNESHVEVKRMIQWLERELEASKCTTEAPVAVFKTVENVRQMLKEISTTIADFIYIQENVEFPVEELRSREYDFNFTQNLKQISDFLANLYEKIPE